ncbi:scavenger receptor class B member 1-like [Lytechinus variegatus]|uniref:scavenger receptor class B member 1-like n=1 Tax=Lytechinus variegatus TaxID=7654 RepID=UPI001BB1AD28|nr:scavenger receptor class B member 1-like [Lytechinus variegatus]
MAVTTFSLKRKILYGILMALSIGLIVSGCIMPVLMDSMYKKVIDSMMILDESSVVFEEWAHPTLPTFLSYYIVDIQNPEEFKNGAKPIIKDKGPYVYKMFVDRKNLTFHDNGTLTFMPQYIYFFDTERSVGPETDRVITPNLMLLASVFAGRNDSNETKSDMNTFLNLIGEEVTLNLTIGELMWGYRRLGWGPLKRYVSTGEFLVHENEEREEWMRPGFLSPFNATLLYQYNVFDGDAEQKLVNTIDNYWGKPTIDWWWSEEANAIRGTDGTMFHPYVKRTEELTMFNPEYCRSLDYVYEKDVHFRGIPLMRFKLAPHTWSNGTVYPPNAGYCSGNPELCGVSGYMRQDPCREGSPSSISNPHFYEGDPSLINAVEGLNPIKELHEHIMDIEPLMGMPYVLKVRLQINMQSTQDDLIDAVKNIRELTLPLAWFEQSVEADDKIVDDYNTGFVMTANIGIAMQWISICSGIIFSTLIIIDSVKRRSAIKRAHEISEKDEIKGSDVYKENDDVENHKTPVTSSLELTKTDYTNPTFSKLS